MELTSNKSTWLIVAALIGVSAVSIYLSSITKREAQQAREQANHPHGVVFVRWNANIRQGMASFTAKDLGCTTMRDFFSMSLAQQQEVLSEKLSQTALRHGVVPITWEECY